MTKNKNKIYDNIGFTFANKEEDDNTFHSTIEQILKLIRENLEKKNLFFIKKFIKIL